MAERTNPVTYGRYSKMPAPARESYVRVAPALSSDMSAPSPSAVRPQFPWPVVGGEHPIWTGNGFRVGGERHGVLDYEAGESGWSEDLTQFHEDVAGEGHHPIDVASRRRGRAALRRHLHAVDPILLEAGCSSGFLLRELVEEWPRALVIGSDYIRGPLDRLAHALPTMPLLRFDLVKCPLPTASVDGIVMLNVLEHIEDDAGAMAQAARLLKPGGVAVIEVPAGPGLFDVYDKYLHHFRRYRLRELSVLVQRAGLRVVEQSHLGFLLYPAFAFVKRRNRRWLNASDAVQREVVAKNISASSQGPFLRWATAIEERLASHVRFPFGIRCVLTAVKPR
jgi:SAM-dependent methyltransferase